MSRQFIITNRPVHRRNNKDQINEENDAHNTLNLRFGYYDVNTDEVELIPEVSRIKNKFRAVDYTYSRRRKKFQGSELWFRELYSEMAENSEKNDTLLFIHGFACGYKCLIDNLMHLYESYVNNPDSNISRIAAFSWPSNNSLTQYPKDKADAGFAGVALARGYQKLIQFFSQYFKDGENERCGSNLHLLCHSMGNQVFESMVKNILDAATPYGQVFKEIILAAPDISNDVFEKGKPLSRILDFGERVHVYMHKKDKALVVSHLTKNFKARLGKTGPSNPFSLPPNVNIVDASEIKDQESTKEKLVDHWYYKRSDVIIKDISEVLNGQNTFTQRLNERDHNNYYVIKN